MSAPLRIVVIYPDLLGTYGDGGNGLILARRAQWRGVDSDLVYAPSDAAVPEGDIYCLGGGEDGPQVRAAHGLIDDGTLVRRVQGGATVLAVCAGYQIVGERFAGSDGSAHDGVGLLAMTTVKGTGTRAVGEVTADLNPDAFSALGIAPASGFPTLSGFENHGGVTTLAQGTIPLASVRSGIGNGDGSGTEGALDGRVVGTYLHGPVLARNPVLADLVLSWALDVDMATLGVLDDDAHEALRRERLEAVAPTARRRVLGRRGN